MRRRTAYRPRRPGMDTIGTMVQRPPAGRPRCLNVARAVRPSTPDPEDACQEALLNIANKTGSWGRKGRFTTWMHVVAVNSARTTYRRMKNQAVASDPQLGGSMEKPDPRTTSVIAGT